MAGSRWTLGVAFLFVVVGCATVEMETATAPGDGDPASSAAPIDRPPECSPLQDPQNPDRFFVCLTQIDRQTSDGVQPLCSVHPEELAVPSGAEVVFEFADQAGTRARRGKLWEKSQSGRFAFSDGPPQRVERGERLSPKTVTGEVGDQWVYGVRFPRGLLRRPCTFDPVICVKSGGLAGADAPPGSRSECD